MFDVKPTRSDGTLDMEKIRRTQKIVKIEKGRACRSEEQDAAIIRFAKSRASDPVISAPQCRPNVIRLSPDQKIEKRRKANVVQLGKVFP